MQIFERTIRLAASPEETYAWHAAPGALEKLTPPGEPVRVTHRTGDGIEEGSRVTLLVGRFPFRMSWVAEHRDVTPGRSFSDIMIRGPFAHWHHEHRFDDDGAGGTLLTDRIRYRLPFGLPGRLLLGWLIRRKLNKLFDFRHTVTSRELGIASPFPELPHGRLMPLDDEGQLVWFHRHGFAAGRLNEVLTAVERESSRKAG